MAETSRIHTPTTPGTSSPFGGDSGPLYNEVSPKIVLGTRILGGATVLMVALAFVFCLVRGNDNHTYYLLACNLIVSSFVGFVNAWWYRRGDLRADKYWYMFILCGVIIFQCLATDIFVFKAVSKLEPIVPTVTSVPANVSTS